MTPRAPRQSRSRPGSDAASHRAPPAPLLIALREQGRRRREGLRVGCVGYVGEAFERGDRATGEVAVSEGGPRVGGERAMRDMNTFRHGKNILEEGEYHIVCLHPGAVVRRVELKRRADVGVVGVEIEELGRARDHTELVLDPRREFPPIVTLPLKAGKPWGQGPRWRRAPKQRWGPPPDSAAVPSDKAPPSRRGTVRQRLVRGEEEEEVCAAERIEDAAGGEGVAAHSTAAARSVAARRAAERTEVVREGTSMLAARKPGAGVPAEDTDGLDRDRAGQRERAVQHALCSRRVGVERSEMRRLGVAPGVRLGAEEGVGRVGWIHGWVHGYRGSRGMNQLAGVPQGRVVWVQILVVVNGELKAHNQLKPVLVHADWYSRHMPCLGIPVQFPLENSGFWRPVRMSRHWNLPKASGLWCGFPQKWASTSAATDFHWITVRIYKTQCTHLIEKGSTPSETQPSAGGLCGRVTVLCSSSFLPTTTIPHIL
ncbi:hypothetical protein B0H10DRAFT_1951270 [Mycena sp. CBHHK59/15]|nr:hypothetical protein B0H10DRAFT_1951270 [Mycena sp. CBHHK59/15]